MIRVNLLKTKVSTVSEQRNDAPVEFTDFENEPGVGNPLVNLLAIAVFVLALMGYEYLHNSALEDQARRLNIKATKIEAQVNSAKKEALAAAALQAKIKELKNKGRILKELTRSRMIQLKALDFLQSIIPDRVWLNAVTCTKEKFNFKGFAVADEDLTEFVNRLESRSYFANVILLSATEAKIRRGTVKRFEITSDLEVPK